MFNVPVVNQENPPECHGQVGDHHEPVTMEATGVPEGTTFECPECDTEIGV